jgi:peptidyl-dipeptidase Dcp
MLPTQAVGPFTLPCFPDISPEQWDAHLANALEKAEGDLWVLLGDPAPPSFENTVVALERLAQALTKDTSLFFVAKEPHATPELQVVAEKWAPLLSMFSTKMFQDEKLFDRFERATAQAPVSGWSEADGRLLKHYRRAFREAGLGLPLADRQRLSEIAAELSVLGQNFHEACQTAAAAVLVLPEASARGLSAADAAEARDRARQKGQAGLGFVLQPTLVDGWLAAMEDRPSREALWRATAERGRGLRDTDTSPMIARTMALRQERAARLGFANPSAHLLENTMAATPAAAMGLLQDTWNRLRPALVRDLLELKPLAAQDGIDELKPWDLLFYAERCRRQNYQLDEAEVRAYLPLQAVRAGAFRVASTLFQVDFEPVAAQMYHPSAQAFLVRDRRADNQVIGLLSLDDEIRPTKSSGAWMDQLQSPSGLGAGQAPIVVNVCNFPAAQGDTPALLSMDDAVTAFHELGHGLHALLSRAKYPSQAGTRVLRDFVELPSQIMENWVNEPESLKTFARHWQTGESIPDDLVERMQRARKFGEGFVLGQYLTSAIMDIALHERATSVGLDLDNLEREILSVLNAPEAIQPRHRFRHFSHLFSGDDYASAYYCYLWAEVLEADAFTRFTTDGLFNERTGAALRDTIFAAGDSRDPARLFEDFVGRSPSPDALLARRGLLPAARSVLRIR